MLDGHGATRAVTKREGAPSQSALMRRDETFQDSLSRGQELHQDGARTIVLDARAYSEVPFDGGALTFASATQARARTFGLVDLSIIFKCLIGSSPAWQTAGKRVGECAVESEADAIVGQ
eukprot:3185844-Pleurochrysis_carterae.AAC.1